jgi:hypothetical protein
MIARHDMSDICADGFDDPGAFVTEHDGRRRREVKMHGRDVRMAQPSSHDSDQDLIRERSLERQTLLQKRTPGMADYSSSNFHHDSLGYRGSNRKMFR